MKRLSLLLLIFFAACTAPQPELPGPPEPTEQQQFAQALDLLAREHSPRGLRDFQQQHPQSPWTVRAETIIRYVQEVTQRKAQLAQARSKLQAEESVNVELEQEKQALHEKIDQLKVLLIELEQRPQ